MDLSISPAPEWSLWLGSLGKFFVWSAIAFFVISQIAWLFSYKNPNLKKLGAWGFTAGGVSLFATFIVLGTLFAANRFEFAYVYQHGDKLNTLQYRIAGIWSGQQGSFLLWGVTSAIFGLWAVRSTGDFRRWFTIPYAGFLSGIAGILAFESPFGLNLIDGKPVVPPDGVGLSPSLQNYWVIIHPPTIFLGFGSLTVLFAFAIAAMARRDFDGWIHKVRPWTLVSVALVGLGLCMGGFWAYETLGWGGFWGWDPVENTSFVPWCLAVALLHGIIVQTTRGRWKWMNLLFSALPFLAFMYGTFLTRSGFLSENSVHSFAEMDRTALWIMAGIGGISILVFLGLWIRSFKILKSESSDEEHVQGVHREGMYRWGNITLCLFAAATAIGMSVPFINTIFGQRMSVATEASYHMVLSWFFFPLMLLMAFAPFIRWKGEGLWDGLGKLYGSFCITIGLLGTIMLLIARSSLGASLDLDQWVKMPLHYQMKVLPWMMMLIGACLFVMVANVWRIVEMAKRSKTSLPAFVAHVGVAVVLAGLVVSRGFEKKAQVLVQEGNPGVGLGYMVSYAGQTRADTDRENKLVFDVQGPDGKFQVRPGHYFIPTMDGQEKIMTWPYIIHHPLHDFYFALGARVRTASDPITLEPGHSVNFEGINIQYLGLTREGQPGQPGTKFGAKLQVGSGPHKLISNPKMEISGGGPTSLPDVIGDEYFVTLERMDAATSAATIQLHFQKPIYPIEIFYKPMTILVWLGTGILTFAGFWAAFIRRRAAVIVPEEVMAEMKLKPGDDGYAPAPAPQI